MSRLRIWTGMGVMAKIVGLSFAAGVAGLIAEHGWTQSMGVLVVFAIPTTVLVFGHRGVDLDKASGRIVEWWGLGFPLVFGLPFRRRVYPLDQYTEISFADRRSRSSRGGTVVYPVWLSGPQASSVVLARRWTYFQARRCAERAARFLGVTFADTVGGNESRRSPQMLDRALVKVPPRETTEIVLRERRYFTSLGIWTLPAAAGAGLWALFRSWTPESDLAIVVVCLALGAVVAGCAGINRVLKPVVREKVVVSPSGLRVERRMLVARRAVVIPWDELEELDVGWPRFWDAPADLDGRKVVCARSDRSLVEFGFGLSDAELDLLRTQILGPAPTLRA